MSPLPSFALILLLQGSDWHLPALKVGPAEELRADPGEHGRFVDRRYHARWEVEIGIAATARDEFGLFLEAFDENGALLAADREHEGDREVALVLKLAAGARVRVRAGSAAPEEGGVFELQASETPDQRTIALRALPADAGSPAFAARRGAARIAADPWITRADAAIDAGDDAAAEEALQRAIELLEPVTPPDDPQLVASRIALADTRFRRNAASFTRAELEEALELAERCDAISEQRRLRLSIDLANVLDRQGDVEAARAFLETIVPAAQRAFPATDDAPIIARLDLAFVLLECGELARARELAERALAEVLQSRPRATGVRLQARGTLVSILIEYGDAPGARSLQEENIAEVAELRPPGHPDLLSQRLLLARLDGLLDRPMDAFAVQSDAIEKLEAGLPETRELLAIARLDLARTERRLGRPEAARARLGQVLEAAAAEGIHGALVNEVRRSLGQICGDLGEWEQERAIEEALARELEGSPGSESLLMEVSHRLALTLAILGERAQLATRLDRLAGVLDAARAARPPFSYRELGEAVRQYEAPLATLLSLAPQSRNERLAPWLFEWVESLRALTAGSGLVPFGRSDPELEAARTRVRAARCDVDGVVARLREAGMADPTLTKRLADAVRLRDDVERRLLAVLERAGRSAVSIRLPELARRLAPDAAAVGFRRYQRFTGPAPLHDEAHLLAHVVLPDGTLHRVELGAAARITDAVQRWRAALELPGAGVDRLGTVGRELYELVLAPVFAACPKATTLHVCLDDVLFLVPLDVLPLPDGALVGDRIHLHLLPSFAPLVAPPPPCTTKPSLLACGGIDYGASALASSHFAPLPATRFEVERIADLFRGTHGGTGGNGGTAGKAAEEGAGAAATSLLGARANKALLCELAPRQRFLHLATHGWIEPVPERGLNDGDRAALDDESLGPLARVRSLAPMTLCGLALAGANRGRDERGLPVGLMSAEELAGLDLSACELAVLSACDTNVGVAPRRAGQGIQSLQSALHVAGARSAITSLWRVDDLATRELMEQFYGALWREQLSKSAALWKAKMALRGRPVRTWAGWVLSGTDG